MNKRDLLKTVVLFVLIVGLTVGSAFALNLVTGPKIAADEQKREELLAQQAAGELLKAFPGATGFEDITSTLTISTDSGVIAVHKETSDKGYVFIAESKYGMMANMAKVTVGVDREGKIVGILVNIQAGDYSVNDSVLNSYIGKDSTLAGVELQALATHSSTAIKNAVAAGFGVLTANDLMKAAVKTTEQVFEELLPTIYNGFVKGEDLAASGNVAVAYKNKTETLVVCYVTKGEDTLLAVSNVSGVVLVYKPELLDEATQTYKLVDVTDDNSDVISEVAAYASANITSTLSRLTAKIGLLFEGATEITEMSINTQSSISSALSFVFEGNTYYAYLAKTINAYNGSVVTSYVIFDGEGKIAKYDMLDYFGDEEYFGLAHDFDKNSYVNGFAGLTDLTIDAGFENGGELHISGATMTSNAVKEAVKAAFAEHNSKGGNN